MTGAKDTIGHYKWLAVAKLSPVFDLLRNSGIFDHVNALCLFVGHGRSGSTLVGALLNAHPNIVMSNELHALNWLERGLTQRELFNLIYFADRRSVQKGSLGGGGYKYAVPGQWQGKHETIKVIGDRKAGATATLIRSHPDVLEQLERDIDARIQFIHVVRNPYDAITTSYQKTKPYPGEGNIEHLRREIEGYFNRCEAVRDVIRKFGSENLKLTYHEDMVCEPGARLADLCGFLGLDASADYLADCGRVVRPNPHKSRFSTEWPLELLNMVGERMSLFPWLNQYSYEQ